MIERIYAALLLLLVSSTLVAANAGDTTNTDQGPVWVDPGWRRTIVRYAVTFDEQGLSTTVFDFEIQALNEKGAKAIAQQTTAYNSYFDELSASDLATVKADGSVITVDERAIRDQPASANSSSPYFDEMRQRIIAYPHLAPGDKVKGRLTYKAKRPMFAGEFARYWNQPADQPPETIELTVEGQPPGRCALPGGTSNMPRKGPAIGLFIACASNKMRRSRARSTTAGSTMRGVSRSARLRIMPPSRPC